MPNSSYQDLPQEWTESLVADAAVCGLRTAAAIGEPLLDFSRMNATTFEKFCWWLLKKEWSLIGCKRLGRSGTEQGGIDLFAFDEQQPEKLSVFECKARKDFTSTNLKEAIDAFLSGSWAGVTRKFTLILAQQDVGRALASRWTEEMGRLKRVGIDAELWTAHTLTLKVQIHPDVLTKFFPWVSVEHHANLWMQRVGFYELVSKAFFDPRERVRDWARELTTQASVDDGPDSLSHDSLSTAEVALSSHVQFDTYDARRPALVVDGVYRRVSQTANAWYFNGPWFSLSAILPEGSFSQGSAAITFNRPDIQGLTITLDHKWLLKRFLSGSNAPLTDACRGFIVGKMPHDSGLYMVDLPHCRFSLEEDGVREIAWVADMLATAMRKSLRSMETAWTAQGFPFVTWGGRKVGLAAISLEVWNVIRRFADEHDVSNGTTSWHMFDGNSEILKPYHQQSTEHFDAGYHGVFYAVKIEGLSFEREVVLLWQPDDLHSKPAFSPRGWWACEFAFQWLTETLLPEIKQRIYRRSFGKRWKEILHRTHARSLAAHLDERFVARDLRQHALMRDGQWSAGLVESVIVLQRFFHIPAKPEPYIHQRDLDELFRAVALVAQGGKGYVGFAGSKLGLRGVPQDHAALVQMIHEHVRERRVMPNSAVVDNVFRAMLELLDDSDEWLSSAHRETIKAAIEPFARIRDDAALIEQHTRWS